WNDRVQVMVVDMKKPEHMVGRVEVANGVAMQLYDADIGHKNDIQSSGTVYLLLVERSGRLAIVSLRSDKTQQPNRVGVYFGNVIGANHRTFSQTEDGSPTCMLLLKPPPKGRSAQFSRETVLDAALF